MGYKSIQQANLDAQVERMERATDQADFDQAQRELDSTLDAIANSDRKTYDEYAHHLDDEFE